MSNGMPHVILISYGLGIGSGAEIALAHQVRHLKDDVRFTVIATDVDPSFVDFVHWIKVPAPRGPFLVKLIAFAWLSRRKMKGVEPGIVHMNGPLTWIRSDVIGAHFLFHDVPLLSLRELTLAVVPRRLFLAVGRIAARMLESWCFRRGRTGHVVVVSEGGRIDVTGRYPDLDVTVVPNGVDSDVLASAGQVAPPPDAGGVRRLLFVGNDWERKGLRTAMAAVALLPPSVILTVVGSGDTVRYGQFARALGVADRVTFLGKVTDTRSLYDQADVFVLPTEYEMFCLAMLEAASAGLPIVTAPVNGTAELLGGIPGCEPQPREAPAIASAVQRLLDDPGLSASAGASLAARARSYTWSASAARLLAVYTTVLETGSRTGGGRR